MKIESFEENFISSLREKLQNQTEREFSNLTGIASGYINALKNRRKPCRALSIETLLKLFPHATINLHGDSVIADNSGINNGVMGVNNGTVNSAGHESVENFRHKIQDEIIRADVDPEAKVKILNIILNTEVNP